MILRFSDMPGRRERHLRRKLENPLFPAPVWTLAEHELLDIQRLDREERTAFLADLRDLVQRAVDLRPTEDFQVILDLKADLDEAYERASGLGGDQVRNKDAIRTLVAIIMSTVRAAAAGDPVAERELDDEDEARRLHMRLLEHPLVADLLDPESLISSDELAATLLTESPDAVGAALELFDTDQLALLGRDARRLLAAHERLPARVADAPKRASLIESRLATLAEVPSRQKARRG